MEPDAGLCCCRRLTAGFEIPEEGHMDRIPRDEAREERIRMEIVVDAYGPEERVLSWYYYLDERISYADETPLGRCIRERAISPLLVGDDVELLRMAPLEECRCEMFVMIRWGTPGEKQGLGVPLSQVEVYHAKESIRQAVEDWHYWVNRGYEF
jgi:hypothetical protein